MKTPFDVESLRYFAAGDSFWSAVLSPVTVSPPRSAQAEWAKFTGFNIRPDPLGRGLTAARRAVELAPSNHLGPYALATALFFLKETQAFRNEVQRVITLNPMDDAPPRIWEC
jgi:hypothetical protein